MGSSTNPHDPMLPLGSDKCKCSVCGEYFNSTFAFDKHRPNRTCMTKEQMLEKGWAKSATGHWHTPGRRPIEEDRV